LIGLSPLSTTHPSGFQPTSVRASTRCYPGFTLAMDRSRRFRVCPRVLTLALFRLAFASAPALKALTSHTRSNSPDHNAKGTPSPAAHPKMNPGSDRLYAHGFRIFSLAVRRSFHRSLTVLSTIGHKLVFSLGGWSPQLRPGFLVPRPTRDPDQNAYSDFAYGTLTPFGPPFQARSAILSASLRQAPQPRMDSRPHGLGSSPFARRYLGNLT
jgi:hypothetical protein